jgi:hypothetical protein
MHPQTGRDFSDVSAAKVGPNRVQPLLDNRQDNQCHSRPPVLEAPVETPPNRMTEHGRCKASP